jgi:hypothetical protein
MCRFAQRPLRAGILLPLLENRVGLLSLRPGKAQRLRRPAQVIPSLLQTKTPGEAEFFPAPGISRHFR